MQGILERMQKALSWVVKCCEMRGSDWLQRCLVRKVVWHPFLVVRISGFKHKRPAPADWS